MPPLILHIDDSRELPGGAAEALEEDGYQLQHTGDPEEAMRLVEEHSPALVLMEIELKGCEGLDLMAGIRDPQFGSVPVLVVTHVPRDSAVHGEAIALGVADFLTKPVRREDLLAAIYEVVPPPDRAAREAAPAAADLSGELADTPMPELLARLRRRGANGVLAAGHAGIRVGVQLRNGSPVGVSSSRREIVAEAALFETFRWESGRFAFSAGLRLESDAVLELPDEPAGLLLAGVLDASPARQVHERLAKRASFYVATTGEPESALEAESLAFTGEQRELLDDLGGADTLSVLLESGAFNEKLVYALWVGGWLELRTAPTLTLTDLLGVSAELEPDLEYPGPLDDGAQEFTQFERTRDQHERELAELARTRKEREQKLEELARARKERERELEELTRAREERERELEELAPAVDARSQELAALARKRKERERELEDLGRAREERERELEELARAREAHARELQELAPALDERSQELAELARKREEHARELEELARARAERERELEELARKREQSARELEELAPALDERAQELKELGRARAERKKELEDLAQARAERAGELEELAQAREESARELEELVRSREERARELEELGRARAERARELEELTRAREQRAQELEELAASSPGPEPKLEPNEPRLDIDATQPDEPANAPEPARTKPAPKHTDTAETKPESKRASPARPKRAPKRAAARATPARKRVAPAPAAAEPKHGEIALVSATRGPASDGDALSRTLRDLAERVLAGDDFQALGIAPSATDEEARAAYEAILEEIPQIDPTPANLLHAQRAKRIRSRIEAAFANLQDEEKRRAYSLMREEEEQDRKAKPSAERALEGERWFRKGRAHLERRRCAEAIEAFGMASHLDPEQGEYASHLGYALYLSNPHDEVIQREAMEHVAKGIKRSPQHELSYVYLGRILKAKGDIDVARKIFLKALRIKPDFHPAVRELRVLEMRERKVKGVLSRLIGR